MPPGGPVTSDSDIESVLSLRPENTKVRRNSLGPKYICSVDECEESFKRLDHLDRHEYKHTGIKRHVCYYDGCSKAYTIITHLKRHVRSTHEKQEHQAIRNVRCEVDTCNKLFISTSNMQRHIREVHENPKIYKCQFCPEKFSQKLKMRRHEISKHTKVYPYNCEKCSRGFYQQWQWEKHRETCKVYPCPSCEQIFEKWSLFLKHGRESQHSRKYYKCEFCDRSYVKPVELQKHVAAKHLINKESTTAPYKCHHEGCEKSYAYERNLRTHVITAHEGKKFKCNNCIKIFSSAQNLQKHLNRDHSTKSTKGYAGFSNALLKRKKRKDAGVPKMSHLVKLSGITVHKALNERLKCREENALEEVTRYFSQEVDINSNSSGRKIDNGSKCQ